MINLRRLWEGPYYDIVLLTQSTRNGFYSSMHELFWRVSGDSSVMERDATDTQSFIDNRDGAMQRPWSA